MNDRLDKAPFLLIPARNVEGNGRVVGGKADAA